MRHGSRVGGLAILLWGSISLAAPFHDRVFSIRQPDGSLVSVRGWGDEYSAVFETPDGHTVVCDPDSGFTCFARLSGDGQRLVSTGERVSAGRGGAPQVGKHLRAAPEVVRAEALARWRSLSARCRYVERRSARLDESGAVDKRGGRAPPAGEAVGTYRGLCILIDFADVPATIDRDEVDAYCNGEGYTGFGNNGSVYEYFHENSDGKLEYRSLVTAYYRAKHDRTYYEDEAIAHGVRARELIREALTQLKREGFDFGPLSTEGGAWVRAVNVFYAGECTNNWAKGLWPHKSSLSPGMVVASGRTVRDYQISDMPDEGLELRTFCHEGGHLICDFPDLYDYGYESGGVGNYCLMAGGGDDHNPVRVCAYLRYHAGWVDTVSELNGASGERVADAAGDEIFLYRRNQREYFLIENRFKAGRDESLPSSGLAVWHVDEGAAGSLYKANEHEQMTAAKHYECALVQADGLFELENGNNWGDGGDLFSAEEYPAFGTVTFPAATWWNGKASGLRIVGIGDPGDTVRFTVVPPDRPGVVRVGAGVPDGVYGAGSVVPVLVDFDRPVTVVGTPRLLLDTVPDPAEAIYVGGTGTRTLRFEYEVAPGEASSRLEAAGSQALLLDGAAIRGVVDGGDADVTLPAPGHDGSLGVENDISVDAGALAVAIGPPSLPTTDSAPVHFMVTYSAPCRITLVRDDVDLVRTGSADGTVAVTGHGDRQRTVSIGDIRGQGSLAISVRAGTATTAGDEAALPGGPSDAVTVMRYGPTQVRYALDRTWGRKGSGNGQFFLPNSVALHAGEVFVADTMNSRIQVFSARGKFLRSWGQRGLEDHELWGLHDIATDGEGNVYVTGSDRVQKFSGTGEFLMKWGEEGSEEGQFMGPNGIVVQGGRVYVADYGNARIQVFDTSGQFLWSFGEEGEAEGEFRGATDLTVGPSGRILVADYHRHRVLVFTDNGQFVREWGQRGTGAGELEFPLGLDVDPFGDVFVVDHNGDRVQKFDGEGRFLCEWGRSGSSKGAFNAPADVVVGDQGQVYVVDAYNHRVQVFAPVVVAGGGVAKELSVSQLQVGNGGRTGTHVVPITFKLKGAAEAYEVAADEEFTQLLAAGALAPPAGDGTYRIEGVDLAAVPDVGGRKTIHLRVTHGPMVGQAAGDVRLVLPKVSALKINGNNKAGMNVVPVSFKAMDAETYTVYWDDGGRAPQVLAEGDLAGLDDPVKGVYTVPDVDISDVPIVKGKKTILATCANEVGEALKPAIAKVTLVLPKVSSLKVDGNNKSGTNTVPVSFKATDAETYTIYWDDGGRARQVLDTGDIAGLDEPVRGVYTVPDVDISDVPTEKGKKTVSATCANEVGEALRPATAKVTLVLPKVGSLKVNGNNKSGTNTVPVSFKATDAETYTIYWDDGGRARQVLDTGDIAGLDEPVRGVYTVPDVDIGDVPVVKGKKTIYATCGNEVGEALKPAKALVTMAVPKVSAFKLANGAAKVNDGAFVTLDHKATNDPTEYRASDTAFTADTPAGTLPWMDYGALEPFEVTGAGTETVYFQVRNDVGHSNVVSDSIFLEAFWTGTWVGMYQITENQDANVNNYNGELENGDIVLYLSERTGMLEITFPDGDRRLAQLDGNLFSTGWFSDKDGDDNTFNGEFDGQDRLDVTWTIEEPDGDWFEDGRATLFRPDAGVPAPDLAGVWIVESDDIIDAWWWEIEDAGGNSEYGAAADFTSDPVTLLEIKGAGPKATARDLVWGESFKGPIEAADDGNGAVFVFTNSGTWVSGRSDAAGTEFAGSYYWYEEWREVWDGDRVEGGDEGFGHMAAFRYTGARDLANGTTRWDLTLGKVRGDTDLATNDADGTVTVSGHTFTLVIDHQGDRQTVRGKVYDGYFVAKNADLSVYGQIDGTDLTGTFEFDDDEDWIDGTLDGEQR